MNARPQLVQAAPAPQGGDDGGSAIERFIAVLLERAKQRGPAAHAEMRRDVVEAAAGAAILHGEPAVIAELFDLVATPLNEGNQDAEIL